MGVGASGPKERSVLRRTCATSLLALLLASGCGGTEDEAAAVVPEGAGGQAGHDHHHDAGVATGALCPAVDPPTWDDFGRPFVEQYCNRCHAAAVVGAARESAPVGVDFDTVEGVRASAEQIDLAAGMGPQAHNDAMPPDGATPTHEERMRLAEWLACGAP